MSAGAGQRTKTVAVGLAVVAAYLAGAVVSGRLSPFARGPLFDALTRPQSYRWVSPPPTLRATNMHPLSGRFSIAFTGGHSTPGVFHTTDGQAVLVLTTGAIPPVPGRSAATITLIPLAPASVGTPPGHLAISGNVYRISATYSPGSTEVAKLATSTAEVALRYPVTSSIDHTLLQSANGRTWGRVPASDSLAQMQVLATKVGALGYFAVAVPASGASPAPPASSSGGLGGILTGVIAGVALIVLGLALRAEYVRRRKARAGRSRRGPPPRHR